MVAGRGGMGTSKHRKSGYVTKSPRARFKDKLEAERNEVKATGRLKDPKQTVAELFTKGK